MERKGPFIHKFFTGSHFYIYDVHTMEIVKVSKAVWTIVDDIYRLDNIGLVAKYGFMFSEDKIVNAASELRNAIAGKGLFSPSRPEVEWTEDVENAREELKQTFQLTLKVTEDCNFDCSYCSFNGKFKDRPVHEKKNMTWETARRAVMEYLKNCNRQNPTIGFYGGEPLLNMDLIKNCVYYAKSINPGVKFSITTNGSLLKGSKASFLAKEKFNILVSLDVPEPMHDINRPDLNGNPTWQRVADNIKTFNDLYPEHVKNFKLRVNTVIASPNDIKRVLGYLKQETIFNNPAYYRVSNVNTTSSSLDFARVQKDESKRIYREYLESLATGEQLDEETSHLVQMLFERAFLRIYRRKEFFGAGSTSDCQKMAVVSACIPGTRRIFVNTDGQYFPCEKVGENDRLCIGNIHDGIDTEKCFQLVYDWVKLTSEECENCWCVRTCQVGCWDRIDDMDGDLKEQKRKLCESHRKTMEAKLKDFCQVLEKNANAFDHLKNYTLV